MSYENASASACKGCHHSARTNDFIPLWKNSLSQHKSIITSVNTPPILKAASEKGVRDIESMMVELGEPV